MQRDSQPGRPDTLFAETPRGYVGYQVFGKEAPDLVFITNWITNLDALWDEPSAARFMRRLGSMGRVIIADKRGSGVSDPPARGYIDPVEDTMDDVTAVMDEVGSKKATLIGDTEGGMLAMVLAATYPERFPALILINAYARFRRAEDFPIGAPDEVVDRLEADWRKLYGVSADSLILTAPSMADDARFRAWYVRYQRLAMAPSVAHMAIRWIGETDVRAVLPAIQAETLVIQRRDAQFHRVDHAHFLTEHIDGAQLRIIEGSDTIPFHAGEFTPVLDEVEEFITGERMVVDSNRMLSTVLFTDIVGSTALASRIGDARWLDLRSDHDKLVRENLARFRGREISMTGDGALAMFDGPQRAILCALSLRKELSQLGIDMRAGIHTGEVEIRDGEVGGLAVHIASRVMNVAESGGVMVSGTVKDLVIGSPLDFSNCGPFELKGIPGQWNLYEANASSLDE